MADQSVTSDIESKFVPANLLAEKNRELAERLGVRIYPTTVIMSPQLQVLDRMTGFVGPEEIRDRLRVAAETASTRKR